MEKIFLFGAGNHAKAVINIIEKQKKYHLVGIIDTIRKKNTLFNGYRILGHQKNIKLLLEEYGVNSGIVSIGDNYIRGSIMDFILKEVPNFNFINAIHPSVLIEKGAVLGKGITIMPNVIINPESKVGDGCFINSMTSLGQSCVMYKYSSLSAGVTTGGNIKINKFAAILIGAVLFDRITIGEHSIIGGGSLVTKDIPAYSIAYGSPAKVIRQRTVGEKYLK